MRSTLLAAAVGIVAGAVVTAGITLAQGQGSGIPSSAGVDHVGITVPNLDEAIDFFETGLGCEHIYTAGPFSDPEGDWMKVSLGVHPRASTTLAMVRCGPTQNIELFEYEAEDQVKVPPKNSDVGGMHIAFYVEDMEKAVAYLKAAPNVKVLGEPTPVDGQPNGGEVFLYFLSPWGSSMEIVSYNDGLQYEKETDKRHYSVRGH
jgi:catechol 2,3-dioxygenase-like lactoylglutathione lyase family enzyme